MRMKERRALVDRYIGAYNAFDVEAMISGLHEDIVFRNISGGAVTHETAGIAAFRAQAEQGAKLFASRRQTVTGVEPAPDGGDPGLVVRIDFAAVLASDPPPGMEAGATLRLTGESEFRFRDGRIVLIVDRS